jgi:hypothetical protein
VCGLTREALTLSGRVRLHERGSKVSGAGVCQFRHVQIGHRSLEECRHANLPLLAVQRVRRCVCNADRLVGMICSGGLATVHLLEAFFL